MVAELIKAGCAPDVAASVVARAFVSGVNSAEFRGAPVDKAAEKRRAYDRERKRKSGGIPPESAETPILHIENNINKSSMQRSAKPSRGTRIAPDWKPSEADMATGKQEGLSDKEIDREAARFRDYWTGRAGSGGVKLDWSATWRNWVRTAAEKLGKVPLGSKPESSGVPKFYAKFGSEEQDAWDAYAKSRGGKAFPRDTKGGWEFPTRWPPGYEAIEKSTAPAIPAMRAMQ
jgi:hypothetical protein